MTRGKKHVDELARVEASKKAKRAWYRRNQCHVRAQQATHRRMLEGYYRALKKAQRKIHGILADAGISIVNERELKNPLFNVNGRKVRLSDE